MIYNKTDLIYQVCFVFRNNCAICCFDQAERDGCYMAEEYTEISAEKLHETMAGIPPEKAEEKRAETQTEVIIDDGRIEKIAAFQSPEVLYEAILENRAWLIFWLTLSS